MPKRSYEEAFAKLESGSHQYAIGKLSKVIGQMKEECQGWAQTFEDGADKLSALRKKVLGDALTAADIALSEADLCVKAMAEKDLIVEWVHKLINIRSDLRDNTFPQIGFWCPDPLACMNNPYE